MLDYTTYFSSSSESEQGGRIVGLGKLCLPSGNIYCCDPFLSHEVNAFTKTTTPGFYEVKLYLVDISDWGKRVALASLIFSDQEPKYWLKATYIIDEESVSDFRVDAGLACFMDLETAHMFSNIVDRYHDKGVQRNYYTDILAAEFNRQGGNWDLHYPSEGDPRNIAMYASGLGDGIYSAFWGMDENEQPAMLVADFQLL